MPRRFLTLLLLPTLALASCGQQAAPTAQSTTAPATPTESTPVSETNVTQQLAAFAQRPELQDPETQALLREHASNPRMLESLKMAYGELPVPTAAADEALSARESGVTSMAALATGKAGYAQSVAWGTYAHYRREKARPDYSGLIWINDGCSAPKYTGLGYRDDFRPACDVHDFGYRNLPHLISIPFWPYNRARTDRAFLSNMRRICQAKVWYKEPPCFAAAQAYYEVVSVAGIAKWHR